MGRRLCGGLFPKPTAAPYNGQGFSWSSSFFFFFLWETQKNPDGLIFLPLGRPLGLLLFFVAALRLATPVCWHVDLVVDWFEFSFFFSSLAPVDAKPS